MKKGKRKQNKGERHLLAALFWLGWVTKLQSGTTGASDRKSKKELEGEETTDFHADFLNHKKGQRGRGSRCYKQMNSIKGGSKIQNLGKRGTHKKKRVQGDWRWVWVGGVWVGGGRDNGWENKGVDQKKEK